MKDKIKKLKFPFKIIKTEEYKLLQEVKEDYIKIAEEKEIEPMSDMELLVYQLSEPLFSFGTRMLLRKIKKENKND